MAADTATEAPWAESAETVARRWDVPVATGLAVSEVQHRRHRYGRNQFEESRPRPLLSILVAQLRSIVLLLLVAAAGLAAGMGDTIEALAIAAVIAVNTALGFITEWRATRSMEALRRFAQSTATVLRDGRQMRIVAAELVPGDVVLVEAGDLVPADLRLLEAAKLQADESALTGESQPVSKQIAAIAREATLLERPNMLYRGTVLTRGSGRGVITATGMHTEFGNIFRQVSSAGAQRTPLEKRLDALGRRLVWIVLVMAAVLALISVLSGRELVLSLEVAIALSVAAIPEGLPIVATIALARGMWRMARRNALVTRLSAVETLGATSVILTDKTGTLTENRMTVTEVLVGDGEVSLDDKTGVADHAADLHDLLSCGALCSNASLGDPAAGDGGGDGAGASGDPTELALLRAAAAAGLQRRALLAASPELREEPFDSESKRMATIHRDAAGVFAAVKGAPESVLPLCSREQADGNVRRLDDAHRARWLQRAEELAGQGLRTLAVAERRMDDADDSPYADLVLLGVVGMEDPAREGVADAIAECRGAGVEVIMVTGDHAATAGSIAADVGIVAGSAAASPVQGAQLQRWLDAGDHNAILGTRVFARVTPEQKLRLIETHQGAGRVVAMTGDGVNDAPALKKADIGVAMGVRGTAVAREAAAMVLQDDEFRTIVVAIAQGRAIFGNIRKFAVYLLSCNISEVFVVALATVAGAPLPLLPLQILFLNLVTDVFPALALGVGAGPPGTMQRPPRPAAERILMRPHWTLIGLYGALISAAVLGAMAAAYFALGFSAEKAVTVSFLTLALAQMWHVFSMRDDSRRWVRNEITANPWVWAALLLCSLLIAAAVYVPTLAAVLSLEDPGAPGWTLVFAASVAPVLLAPLMRRGVERWHGATAG